MINHPLAYTRMLADDDIERILSASFNVLSDTGLQVQSKEIFAVMKKAGAVVDDAANRIMFSKKMVEEHLKTVPSEWVLHARNPQRNVAIGGKSMVTAPGYGSAFIADKDGKRRYAELKDFKKFAYLAYRSDEIDVTGGLLVEPNDVAPALRAAEITAALIRNSDKPFMGSVAGREGAKDSLEIAKIVFGDIKSKPYILSLININSPLHLDSRMADAMYEYAMQGQPILLTPGIMMGITAPVTIAGALVQAFAELLGCVTISQVLRPGLPVIIGTGGFGSDLRNGGPGFGRPENALGTQLGAEIARKLKIPFRCSAAVTGARKADCRSGYEKMMTAMTAVNSGAHFCLQAAGILDCINSMSYEQFIIDTEIWSYVKRFTKPVVINDDTIAQEIIKNNTSGLLENEHTVKYMREELYCPALAKPDNYDQWLKNGNSDIILQAGEKAEEILKHFRPPVLDENIEREIKAYISRRKKSV
ncbi:MAG: hypothetical protein A2Y10_02990 [Planctomycetes bacterium GWF2_41_51]|nr:MAG: hypothetical protein A2Y10_02990 [Planctomycetes bacterium GWF2_41_51]HBG27968.1 hypothetical protein [Phycisphaerales bacterium]